MERFSTLTERLISDGLQEIEARERDPALRALLYMIARLAEYISGFSVTGGSTKWRTDQFQFVAFRSAVCRLLHLLEEPPGELLPIEGIEEVLQDYVKPFPPDHPIREYFLRAGKDPEAYGSLSVHSFWHMGRRRSAVTTGGLKDRLDGIRTCPLG